MIPARMGSKRIKRKNLRMINGKQLIEYVLDTVSKINIFDDVYINSEDDVFKEISDKYNFKFYKRPEHLSSDVATNDEFAHDFLKKTKCEILIQILPTSPFITEEEIINFTNKIVKDGLDTLISVEHKQIACIYEDKSINFEKLKRNPPSQTMKPVKAYATALMGWRRIKYMENMDKFGVSYHGGDGKTGYFELRGLSTIDIDREENFNLAEAVAFSKTNKSSNEPKTT